MYRCGRLERNRWIEPLHAGDPIRHGKSDAVCLFSRLSGRNALN
jgi:hypothetical protein